jgi:hypothetical protein
MSDALAVKLFAIANQIEDPNVAREVMYKTGEAEAVIAFADLLEPELEQEFLYAHLDGMKTALMIVKNLKLDGENIKSPNYGEGCADTLTSVVHFLEGSINFAEEKLTPAFEVQEEAFNELIKRLIATSGSNN